MWSGEDLAGLPPGLASKAVPPFFWKSGLGNTCELTCYLSWHLPSPGRSCGDSP